MCGPYDMQDYFLAPVTMNSAGIMSYYAKRNGPPIEPFSTELIPPGNYGIYFDRECVPYPNCPSLGYLFSLCECKFSGFPGLTHVRQRVATFAARFSTSLPPKKRSIMDPIPPVLHERVSERDGRRCRLTGLQSDVVPTWIIPPRYLGRLMDDWGGRDPDIDLSPFFVGANILTMEKQLAFYLLCNHFTVDDNYRILVLCSMGDVQALLPTHLPPSDAHDAAADEFLRMHCRYTLNFLLRGGDIASVYPNHKIFAMMDELGVDYLGSDHRNETEMVPLSDERWQTPLGKAILANVLEIRADQPSSFGWDSQDNPVSRSPSPVAS
ncbi:hypothetical protein C8R43DRAFT_1004427 [Mycena crocata]|nr:hypothetical protein C8R43DRAFT_1004427 [Mycena crocata]